jgi:REP element-mobilizing transposase RayT
MPRGRRLNIRDGIYHTMARGNRKAAIFEDVHDRERFTEILAEAAARYCVDVLSNCQMGTHYHLAVRTPRANLPAFQRYLNGCFAQDSNHRHRRTGHLFGERYKPLLVDNDRYFRVVLAYIALNPVTAGLVEAPADWKWSSYATTVGLAPVPGYLSLDWLDSAFPAPSRRESQSRFCDYVAAPTGVEAEEWLFKVAVGPPSFTREIREHIGATLYRASLPRAYRALARPPLEDLFPPGCSKAERAQMMLRAHVVHGYTMTEIARCLGVHPNTVSRNVCDLRRRWTRV